MLRIGQKAPELNIEGIVDGRVLKYSLQSLKDKWVVLFFYPADFTFICPTEVTGFSRLAPEFRAEKAEILGISVDSIDSHRKWIAELGGINYPLLSDVTKSVSRAYEVLDEKEGVSYRGTFIITPTGEISYIVVSHSNVGRSVEETLRVLKALRSERLCPAGWKPGEATGDVKLKY
jgi:alkyl hydroperoxide reductase subunit AhpC